ncbi:hypothetical protein [Caloramator sp. mosi_1]
MGKNVKVRLANEDYTALYGKLVNFSENNIILNVDGEDKNIKFDDIFLSG